MDVFVVADACTDKTAEEARKAGAITWREMTLPVKEKAGLWIMDNRILNEYGDTYEAFVVMDADNLVAPNYLSVINQRLMRGIWFAQAIETQRTLTQLDKLGICHMVYA